MNLITTLPLRAVKAAIHAAAAKDIRYYLVGVLVEHCNGVLHVVGCDGHIMFVGALPGWESDTKGNWQIILPLTELKLALKALPKTADHIEIRGTPAKGCEIQIGSIAAKAVDGLFPDWRRVTPANDLPRAEEPQQINPELLIRAFDAIGEFDEVAKSKRGSHAYVHHLKGTTVVTGNCGHGYSVVMPLRDRDDAGRVKWRKPEYPADAKAA
jgi:hypothetical protein